MRAKKQLTIVAAKDVDLTPFGKLREGQEYSAIQEGESKNVKVYVGAGNYLGIGADTYIIKHVHQPRRVVPEEKPKDPWSFMADETGVERTTVKQYIIKFLMGDDHFMEIAREHKLSLTQVRHLHTAFNMYTGADD